jgi:hypothetical protein
MLQSISQRTRPAACGRSRARLPHAARGTRCSATPAQLQQALSSLLKDAGLGAEDALQQSIEGVEKLGAQLGCNLVRVAVWSNPLQQLKDPPPMPSAGRRFDPSGTRLLQVDPALNDGSFQAQPLSGRLAKVTSAPSLTLGALTFNAVGPAELQVRHARPGTC